MRSRKKPTAHDVARLAGVSVATVSYVVNGRHSDRIPASTRQRVLAAAHQLAYAPNQSARSLRKRRTERVCLVVSGLGVPAYEQLARDVHASADTAGYSVITIVVDSATRADSAVELLRQQIADGAIIGASVPHLEQPALASLAQTGLPLVVMSNHAEPDGFDVVRAPERAACAEAFAYLLTSGQRRRVAFVAHHHEYVDDPDSVASATSATTSERLAAYLAALADHDLAFDPDLLVPGADDRVAAFHAVTGLLDRADRPDAIFAASDRAAISAIWAVRDAGLRVPEDIAVIGAGNLPEGQITRPPLSTVGPDTEDYSEVSRLLFDRIHATEPPPAREVTTPWRFLPRGSA